MTSPRRTCRAVRVAQRSNNLPERTQLAMRLAYVRTTRLLNLIVGLPESSRSRVAAPGHSYPFASAVAEWPVAGAVSGSRRPAPIADETKMPVVKPTLATCGRLRRSTRGCTAGSQGRELG
jgi:hypothetical protein